MSLFKGFGEMYVKPLHVPGGVDPTSVVGVCVVLDVMLKPSDANGDIFPYQGPKDIGKIRIKPVFQTTRKLDDEITAIAYPADRKTVSYPLPGELVFVHINNSDEVELQTGRPVKRYYYVSTSTQNGSITYNSLPDSGDKRTTNSTDIFNESSAGSLLATVNRAATTQPSNNGPEIGLTPSIASSLSSYINNLLQKFNRKLKNRDSFIKENLDNNNVLGVVVKERPALQPYEGDSVYQGRYGQSIRFGSTTNKNDNNWSKEGLSGAPIMIQRVHDKIDSSNLVSHTTEDINEDNSSIYLCSTQKVEMRLSCSTNMHSWRTIYRIENKSKDPNVFDTVTNKEDGTLIYQKVVDMGQTLDSQLNVSESVAPGSTSSTNQTNTNTPPAGG